MNCIMGLVKKANVGKDACSRESRGSWLRYEQLVEVRASPDKSSWSTAH